MYADHTEDGQHYRAGYNPEFLAKVRQKRARAQAVRLATEADRRRAEQDALRKAALEAAQYRVIEVRNPWMAGREIGEAVANSHGISWAEIISPSRTRVIVAARKAAMIAVAQALPGMSYPQMGRLFNRDHTTILHALGKLNRA